MIQNAYLAEKLGREYVKDALRRAENDRLVHLAEPRRERQQPSASRILDSLIHLVGRQGRGAPVSS
jgi:hypothetical protein